MAWEGLAKCNPADNVLHITDKAFVAWQDRDIPYFNGSISDKLDHSITGM
jgi:hypothetical protein